MLEINNAMKKFLWLIVGLIVLGIIALATPGKLTLPILIPIATTTPSPTPSPTPIPTPPSNSGPGLTAAVVAKHNNAASCYTIISNKVYDLTDWINQHPGGEGAILSICGIDGTNAFNDQHGGQGRPERILQNFYLGNLTN